MPQKLEELEISEVSLVDRPACSEGGVARARIALFKRDISNEKGDPLMTLQEIEKKVEAQDEVIANLKATGVQLQTESAFLKLENAAVLKMSDLERCAYAQMEEAKKKEFIEGDVVRKQSLMRDAIAVAKVNAIVEKLDADTRKRYDAAGPSEQAIILEKYEAELGKKSDDDEDEDDEAAKEKAKKLEEEKRLAKAENDDRFTKSNERIAKAEAELTEFRKRERLAAFTKRAEDELPNTSGSPEEKGSLLMTMADSLPGGEKGDAFTKALAILKSADQAMSVHFQEVGKAGAAVPAEKAFMAKVQEISKRDKIDESHAIGVAMDEAPELYIAYEAQHRAAVRA